MAAQPPGTSSLPRLAAGLPALLVALLAAPTYGCGDDSGREVATRPDGGNGDTDAGGMEVDAGGDGDVDLPDFTPPDVPDTGDPPPGLEGQACAVDTNKLFELAESEDIIGDTMLGVDLIESEFGIVFVDTSPTCTHAVKVARFSGPSSLEAPEVEVALDVCSQIGRTAVAHNFDDWLLATVDDREGPMDVWIQRLGDPSGAGAVRLSDSPNEEIDLAIMAAPPLPSDIARSDIGRVGFAAVIWVEQVRLSGDQSLILQMLEVDGTPNGEPIVLYEPGGLHFTSLTVARIGDDKVGIGYRRFDSMGVSEIVLEVRDVDGVLLGDPRVLTTDGGQQGTIELATDETGGGVAYSIEQGTEGRQVWFQQLDRNGDPAAVMSGLGVVGGPMEPQRVVGLPFKAVDASIAKLPIGYAVVFRALPGGQILEPQIRVQFIDADGRLISQATSIAYAAEVGGRTTVEAAFDGRIAVGWTDATDDFSATTVNVARLPCVR